jgi:hypothetical protein
MMLFEFYLAKNSAISDNQNDADRNQNEWEKCSNDCKWCDEQTNESRK